MKFVLDSFAISADREELMLLVKEESMAFSKNDTVFQAAMKTFKDSLSIWRTKRVKGTQIPDTLSYFLVLAAFRSGICVLLPKDSVCQRILTRHLKLGIMPHT